MQRNCGVLGATAMRPTVLLTLALILQVVSSQAFAATPDGRMLFAQRILSCGEQAATLHLQFTSLKCNPRSSLQSDSCKLIMTTICKLAEKCERAKIYCTK